MKWYHNIGAVQVFLAVVDFIKWFHWKTDTRLFHPDSLRILKNKHIEKINTKNLNR